MRFQIGDTIGNYEITGVLGRGGMGQVFRVRDLISDRIEAMKIILPGLEADAALMDRFLREIKVQAALDHPNIAQLRTTMRIENRLIMILEYVEGASLDVELLKGPIPVPAAVSYIDQVLSALDCAHSHDIIHRDLKPANIMITGAGHVKLTDFGIAQAGSAPKVTHAGMALGSIYYMSPEQVTSRPLDARSDFYSLGVTFFEMVTGKRPMDGENEFYIMMAHLEKQSVPASELNPAVPPALSAIIMKSMAKRPADRYQSAREFQAALRESGRVPDATIPPAQISRLEARLLQAIGPIATRLVATASREHTTLEGLCASLAERIPGQPEREAFLKGCQSEFGLSRAALVPQPPTPAAGTAVRPPVVWDPALLLAAKQQLANFMGPIAGVMVDRAARKTQTRQGLYEALAAEIPVQRDRDAFLAFLKK